jgi:putative membrane protein
MDILKSLHIIFMVSWFAGLFYIVRLFIYHVEAQEKEDQVRTILSGQFEIMEKKLWWIITTPAMVLTVVFGVWMLVLNWDYYKQAPWMHIKLTFVFFLLIYHFICQKIMFQFHQNKFNWTSMKLRLWNEVATLFLVSIVFIVVLKDSFNWIKGVLGFFGVAILLMIGIQWYKRLRKSN